MEESDAVNSERSRRWSLREERFIGATLGAAIGDAMGHPTEFMSMEAIHSSYGPTGVEGFELYWERGGKRFAPYTDDTQMAEAVFRSLLWSRQSGADLDATMVHMAAAFVEWSERPQGGHRAPGNACMSGCRALARGSHWATAGGPQAGGCGSVMRAYPFGLMFMHDVEKAEHWAVAHSRLTHGDPIALAASAAMAVGMARLLRDDPLMRVLSEMVAAACRYSPRTASMMAQAIDEGLSGAPPGPVFDRLQAWAAHEAIASAVYLLARHPNDVTRAILEGANTPGDSDSIATLAGALIGARLGASALPKLWVQEVERSDEFIALAKEASALPEQYERLHWESPKMTSPASEPSGAETLDKRDFHDDDEYGDDYDDDDFDDFDDDGALGDREKNEEDTGESARTTSEEEH